VIADADTGYGNPLNVIRTVGAFEAAGVAGIHIEDQVAPKKCGHLDGKLVIPAEEMAAKVRAAAEARTRPEFVIIARTDARAVEGLPDQGPGQAVAPRRARMPGRRGLARRGALWSSSRAGLEGTAPGGANSKHYRRAWTSAECYL
jgi:hypothetical protein